MKVALEEFGLRLDAKHLPPSHRSFRPPSWPPPRDWVVSEDKEGNVISRWGDHEWDFSAWHGKPLRLRFNGGHRSDSIELDQSSADLLRLWATWRLWGPRSVKALRFKSNFMAIRRLIAFCAKKGIVASNLMRFPRILDEVAALFSPSKSQEYIVELHRLWDARDVLGFYIVDPSGISRLLELIPDEHTSRQTPYIPPRIWGYQVQRLAECLDDFLTHQDRVKACFEFCLEAYARNYGCLEMAYSADRIKSRNPFQSFETRQSRSGAVFLGAFDLTAERFGIRDLILRWIDMPQMRGLQVSQFAAYMSLVQNTALAYIANFTLQRISEVGSLRQSCLLWEVDPRFGRVPIICGETTKTDPDSDARWPTSPSVEKAVKSAGIVAQLRAKCAAANESVRMNESDVNDPYLFHRSFEPWGAGTEVWPYSILPMQIGYLNLLRTYPRLMDPEKLRITEEDLRIAQMLTPTISHDARFEVGKVWPLAWHQLRRTGAVNMFASGLISDSTMQFLMKHSSRLMSLYYGRGYTRLHVNEEAEVAVIEAMYVSMAHKLISSKSSRFVSPHGEDRKNQIVANLVGERDLAMLAAAGRRGETSFREIRLGGCTKRGACSYGGFESVARCAGGDGAGACADALFDRDKSSEAKKELRRLLREVTRLPTGSPRYAALHAEIKGLENYLNAVRL